MTRLASAALLALVAVHRLHPDRLAWNDAALERLAATRRLEAMIVGGVRPEEIFASWRVEVDGSRARSAPHRLSR